MSCVFFIVFRSLISGIYNNKLEGQPQFSEGLRENIFIPGYYGAPNHSLPYLYVFLLGYEGERSYNILTTNNPDFLEVIIPDPGYSPDNQHRTIMYNKDFLKETEYISEFNSKESPEVIAFRYPAINSSGEKNIKEFYYKEAIGKTFFRIDISKIDEVCDKILSIYEQFKEDAEIRLVPLGPKPHAVGAGLAGLIEENISIMYQTPKEYIMNQVTAGEKMWVYKINWV